MRPTVVARRCTSIHGWPSPVELFSVTCITCRSRLKVRHESAIGQILACPKCNGMVQIEPPPGWKRPAKSTAATPQPAAAPVAEESHPAPPADASPLPPGMIVAPHEAQTQKWILIGGGAVAVAIVGFGLWSTFGRREVPPPVDEPLVAVATPTKPIATASAVPSLPKPSATAVATPVPKTTPMALLVPIASSTPSVPAMATPSAPPPIPTATAVPTAAPVPSVPPPAAIATAPTPQPPRAVAATTAPLAPPSPQVDVAARFADKLPEIAFDKSPFRQAVETLSSLSTIRVNYDADSLAAVNARLDEPVTLKLTDTTVGEALERLTAERGLQFRTVGDQLVLFAPLKDAAAPATVVHDVTDLVGTDEPAAARLAELVRRFAVPEAWDPRWGGQLVVAPGKLEVTQQPVGQREAAEFLDRLRLARGKTPKNSQTTLDTRLRRAQDVLEQPVTMNFRPGATLPEITARIEAATGATLLINYLELASQGFFGGERIGIAADKHPAATVLTALCEPRDWAWRIVAPKLIELTTRDAVQRRPYVEFYALPATAGEIDGPGWVTRIRTQLADEPWRDMPGVDLQRAGDLAFDDVSHRLIVRRHQAGHLRIERMLAETAKLPPAAPAPRATPTPTASGTAKP